MLYFDPGLNHAAIKTSLHPTVQAPCSTVPDIEGLDHLQTVCQDNFQTLVVVDDSQRLDTLFSRRTAFLAIIPSCRVSLIQNHGAFQVVLVLLCSSFIQNGTEPWSLEKIGRRKEKVHASKVEVKD